MIVLYNIVITLALFLSCEAGAGSDPDLVQIAASIPDQERFLIFDIRGRVKNKAIVKAFKDMNVVYKFKMYGGLRHVVVTKNDQDMVDAYENLAIKGAREIITHTAEHWGDYCSYLGQPGYNNSILVLPNKNLMMHEFKMLELRKMTASH